MTTTLRAVPMHGESVSHEQALPQNLQAERAVLGAILVNNKQFAAVAELLSEADFHRDSHGKLFSAIRELLERGEPADLVTLRAELERTRQLDAAGGLAYVASLTDGIPRSTNISHYGRIVRQKALERAALRQLERATEAIQQGELDTDGQASALEFTAELLRESQNGKPASDRFADASVSAAELLDRKLEPPRSLVGEGLLVERSFALLYGRPNLGKTWLALELAVAVARGEPWHGLPTSKATVGVLELELPSYHLQDRLRTVSGGSTEGLDRVHVIARPELTGPVDLTDPKTLRSLVEWCQSRGVELLIIDALSRIHRSDENSARDMAEVLDAVARLNDAGVSVLCLHHEPKARGEARGQNGSGEHLDAARGSSRLQSDPHTLIRLHEHRGALCLRAVKVNLGRAPDPVYLAQGEAGGFEVIPEPSDPAKVGAQNREAVRQQLTEAGSQGATVAVLAEGLELTDRTVRRHLGSLGATKGSDGRYRL